MFSFVKYKMNKPQLIPNLNKITTLQLISNLNEIDWFVITTIFLILLKCTFLGQKQKFNKDTGAIEDVNLSTRILLMIVAWILSFGMFIVCLKVLSAIAKPYIHK